MKTRKILIVGTAFSDNKAVKTQGEYLFDLLKETMPDITIVSKHRNYLKRILDIVYTMLFLRKDDVVILQVYSTKNIYLTYLALCLGKLKSCKLVATMHGGGIPDIYKQSPFKRSILNSIANNCMIITAPSHYIASIFNSSYQKKIKIIRNFINVEEYTPKKLYSYTFTILWMRAYHAIYNPIKALEVVMLLKAEGIPVKLHMGGTDLGLLDEVRSYIQNHHLENEVTIYNRLDNEQKNELASICDVYLNTTEVDNSPVSFLEMMAMGLPIVSTNVGGIPFWVSDKINALLSTDNSAVDLKEQIKLLIKDKKLYDTIVHNNFEHVKPFSKHAVKEDWLSLLNHI